MACRRLPQQTTSVDIDDTSKQKDELILKCYYTNATSIVQKLDIIETHLYLYDIDILFVTETWLQTHQLADIPNYNLYRLDRNIPSRQSSGGGVCIYVKSTIHSYIPEIIQPHNYSEQVWCVIKYGMETIICGCIYRPPGARPNKNEACAEICQAISYYSSLSYTGILICGDFNFPDLSWMDSGSPIIRYNHMNEYTSLSSSFADTIITSGLTQWLQNNTYYDMTRLNKVVY